MIKYIKRKIRELLEGKELRLLREEHAFIKEGKNGFTSKETKMIDDNNMR